MDLAPMVLDWDEPEPEVKDAFRKFAPVAWRPSSWICMGTAEKCPNRTSGRECRSSRS
jgi:hypothetical protein